MQNPLFQAEEWHMLWIICYFELTNFEKLTSSCHVTVNLKEFEATDWIHLAHGRVEWQAVVNVVMNLQIPYVQRLFLLVWLMKYPAKYIHLSWYFWNYFYLHHRLCTEVEKIFSYIFVVGEEKSKIPCQETRGWLEDMFDWGHVFLIRENKNSHVCKGQFSKLFS